MNTVVISGRLVYEPEIRLTSNQTPFLSTRIAVNRNDKGKTTDFFNLKAWNSTAKFICQYFHKGDPIEIRGRLETSARETTDGVKSTETYILVEEVAFCLKPAERTEPTEPTMAEQAPTKPSNDMTQNILDSGIAELVDNTPGVLPFEL